MKNALKRSLSLLLAITIIFGSAYVGLSEVDFGGIFAVEAKAATSGVTGDCTWTLDGTVLTISGNGAMEDYPSLDIPWDTNITEVVIGNGVTSIGYSAFENCTSLTSITIPDSVTSIGVCAFYNCTSLTSITIPDSVTSLGSHAFWGCKSLTSIIIPEGVPSISEYTFLYCTRLTSITVDSSNKNYCSVDGVLFNKDKTELLRYPEGKPSVSYTIPNSVTSIGDTALYGCTSLTSITIPDSVTSIGGYAFSHCTSITSITIPNSVTSIGDSAFFNSNLRYVFYTGTETDWNKMTIGKCTVLNNAYIHYNSTDHTYGEYIYDYSNNTKARECNVCGYVLTEEFDSASCLSFTLNDDGESYSVTSCDTNVTGELVIPDTYNGLPVTSIGSDAFYDCTSLTSITIPNSVTSIGWGAFTGVTNLKDVYITDMKSWCNIAFSAGPNNDNPLHKAENLFLNGVLVTDLVIPDGVTKLSGSFCDYEKLTSVTLPDSVTNIDSCAFYGCSNLTSITFPNSVTSIGWGAFYNCPNLTTVVCPGCDFDLSSVEIDEYNTDLLNAEWIIAEHKISDWTIDKTETCTQNGSMHRECAVCGTSETVSIPATGHTASDWIIDVAATCGKAGSKHKECVVCKAKLETKTILATGNHIESDWIIDVDSTCTQKGSKYTECENCGVVLSRESIFEKPHETKWFDLVAPTCLKEGKRVKKCTVCNNEFEIETVSATGHTSSAWIIDTEAICTTNGSKHIECIICSEVLETEKIPATGHTPSEWIIDVEATCTTSGSKHTDCTVCGNAVDTSDIPATGHIAGDWIIDIEATCTTSGSKHIECTVCGDTLDTSEIVATEHVAGEWIVDIEATVSASGSKHKECTTCGEVLETAAIPQLKPSTPKVTTTNEIGGVNVTWNKVDGAVKYNVYRRQGGYNTWTLVGTTTGNTLLDKNVESGIYYVYSVRAYNVSGGYSDFVSANTNTRKYMATPKLTTIYNHVNGLAIKWNAVSGVTNGYRVYRRGAGSTYWTYLGTTKNLYFIDNAVKNKCGEYFRYTVIADGGYHSKFDTTGLYLRRLANPTLNSAVSSKSGITVKWGAVKGTTGYYVYRKTANSTWVRVAAVGGTNTTSYVDTTAKKGTIYTYTVRAVCGNTLSSYYSGISCKDKY